MADTIVSNVALVVKEFLAQIKLQDTTLKTVFDPSLSYDTALKRYRSNNLKNAVSAGAFPLFVFSRSVLRPNDPLFHRGLQKAKDPQGSSGLVDLYTTTRADIDINFLFLTTRMKEIEDFEIRYSAELGVRSLRQFNLGIPSLGEFVYTVKWEDFQDMPLQLEGDTHMGLMASARISGVYFLLTGTFPRIEEIIFEIKEFTSEILIKKHTII